MDMQCNCVDCLQESVHTIAGHAPTYELLVCESKKLHFSSAACSGMQVHYNKSRRCRRLFGLCTQHDSRPWVAVERCLHTNWCIPMHSMDTMRQKKLLFGGQHILCCPVPDAFSKIVCFVCISSSSKTFVHDTYRRWKWNDLLFLGTGKHIQRSNTIYKYAITCFPAARGRKTRQMQPCRPSYFKETPHACVPL